MGKPLYFYKKKRKSRKDMGALCSEIRVAAQHMGIIGRRLLFLQLGTVREHGSNSLATQLRSSLQRLPITKEEFLYFVHHNRNIKRMAFALICKDQVVIRPDSVADIDMHPVHII